MSFDEDRFSDWYQLNKQAQELLESRKVEDLLEELSQFPELARAPEEIRAIEPFDVYFSDKIDSLRDSIQQVSTEITTRHEFAYKFLYQIDYQIRECASSLAEFRHWGLGYNTGVDKKRNHLERMLADLRKERRATELRCWEDIVALRKDLRDTLTEYKDIIRRGRMLQTSGDRNGDR
jgi:hypothetical protein